MKRTIVVVCLALACSLPASAQSALRPLTTSATDDAAAAHARVTRHARRASSTKGSSFRNTLTALQVDAVQNRNKSAHPHVYPGDLSYIGGPTVEHAEFHAVFLTNSRCSDPACWGHPLEFLHDLGGSQYLHVTDQYVGSHRADRYTLGTSFHLDRAVRKKPYTNEDMVAIAHATATAGGFSGYDHIVHIFLPPHQDVCFDDTNSDCYSPDRPNVFDFCGYHASATFDDVGVVLFTVEPFQDVAECRVTPHTPNGQRADSTDSLLAHETIETITDPDGTAWFNITDFPMLFDEIADECELVSLDYGTFDPLKVKLLDHWYAIQPIYSNSSHTCATGP